jgi:hypothetical protein
LQKLGAYALDAATQDGDAHPIGAFVVPTTRRIAEEVAAGDKGEPTSLRIGAGTGMPNLYAMGQPESLPLPSSG